MRLISFLILLSLFFTGCDFSKSKLPYDANGFMHKPHLESYSPTAKTQVKERIVQDVDNIKNKGLFWRK